MAKRIKILRTTAGNYGLATTGNEFITDDQTALQLVANGAAEILGHEPDEAINVPTGKRTFGLNSVRVTKVTPTWDHPGSADDTTNRYDPTNEAKNSNQSSKQ